MESARSLSLRDERRVVLLPLELLLLRLEVELECFREVEEVGEVGWPLSMGPTGTIVMAPKPPRPGTRGEVGDKSSIRYSGC